MMITKILISGIWYSMQAGWLTDITNWFRDQFKAIWDSFVKFMKDLFIFWLEHTVDMIQTVFDMLPAISFTDGQSIGSILGQAGPTVAWFVDLFQIGPSLAVIASAMVFYIVRRLLTLGIW